MTGPPSGRDPREELAEEILSRYRKGERPPLAEYAGRRPDLADRICRVFPTLVFMESLGAPPEADRPPPTGWASPALSWRSAAAAWWSCTRPSRARWAATWP